MMSMTRELVGEWAGGTTILSPRDLTPAQCLALGRDLLELGGEVLFDPQFYLPHEELPRLRKHGYWPDGYSTTTFWSSRGLQALVGELAKRNLAIGSSSLVLPSVFAPRHSVEWVKVQRSILAAVEPFAGSFKSVYSTFSLGADFVCSNEAVEELADRMETLCGDGLYLVAEMPSQGYLTDNAIWIANLLDLVAAARMAGKSVIVGCASHQLLACASAGASMIASGNFLNVRSFTPTKFKVRDPEPKMRSTWFYAPTALSEFKLPTLDLAQRLGVLGKLRPQGRLRNIDGEIVFFGGQPSTSGFAEPNAFRHYLRALRVQAAEARKKTFDETVDFLRGQIGEAQQLLAQLRRLDIYDSARGFAEPSEAVLGALRTLEVTRGAILRRSWPMLD